MIAEKPPMLSKSRFIAGLQCPLRLWFQCYNRELATEVSPSQQAIFDMGHEVGRLATHLYPGGVLIEEDHLHHREAVESTRAALENPNIRALYEAAFIHDSVRIRVDILERLRSGKWNMIEVKSSTSVKEVHLPDVAVQYYVLQGLGLDVVRAGILHLNNQYVYDGYELDLEQLFSFSDLTEEAFTHQEEIPPMLLEFKQMLAAKSPPEISPCRHCMTPYRCEFWEHCTQEKPEFWVMNLSGISKKKLNDLAAIGVEDISEIPDSFTLTGLQARIKACVANKEEYLSPELEDELRDVKYPIHFMDFETISPAIPCYSGTRPYQTIPFQWSDHVLYEDGSLEHWEYLHDEDSDPREEFTRKLLEILGDRGTVFIYTTYEVGVMKSLAEVLPHYAEELLATLGRIKDLYAAVRRHFYHPHFHGSFSLKKVLPVLVPSMGYETLAIQEGNQASIEYHHMIDPSTPQDERNRIRMDLLTYCAHDTLAMVKIREELLKRF